MNTCEDHGCVVVYDTRNCPVCGLDAEKQDAENKLAIANDDISDLKNQVKDLQAEIEILEKK